MTCSRCDNEAEPGTLYCFDCKEQFRGNTQAANERADPAPGVHLTGKLNNGECPKSFFNGVSNVCGMCGQDELEPGYGFAGNYGLGSYNYCGECMTVLDFSEDTGD